jgi:tripeptide aminopeptidase
VKLPPGMPASFMMGRVIVNATRRSHLSAMSMTLTEPVRRIAEMPAVEKARLRLHETDALTVREQCTVAGIASPPFGESVRGEWLRERFRQLGLEAVRRDDAGNVIAEARGLEAASPVIVAAHLDTVFPAETRLELRTEGDRFYLPGIADNARGLATMLAIARVVGECGIVMDRTIVFVGSVGEEGIGDLRGVKHLFRPDSPFREATAFIALDGTESRRIVCRAVGSSRHRVVLRGPGGHSWADRGTPNAIHALGTAVAALARLRLPARPAWSVNVGRIGGGTSINAIPEDAWLELDLRSEDPATLERLEGLAFDAVHVAAGRGTGNGRPAETGLDAEILQIGLRPAGETAANSKVVRLAKGTTHFLGHRPELVASSTDANVPMSLGIPAISIGGGGESGGMHTAGEWFANTAGARGIERALLIVLAAASAS